MAKTFVQLFEEIWLLIRFCSAYCGANVTKANYRMNCLTWFLIIAIKIFFFLTGYTVYVSVVVEGDWIVMLQNLCTLGNGLQVFNSTLCGTISLLQLSLSFQGYVKLISYIYYKDNIRSIFEELHAIYVEYEKRHAEYQSCLKESIHFVSKAIKFIAIVYLATIVFIGMCPVFYYLAYGEKILLLQFYIPGIDHNTKVGYACLMAMHVMCLLFASFGNFSADMFFFNPVSHVPLMKDIMVCKLHDLNQLLLVDQVDSKETMNALKDIIKWHQKYMNYLHRLKTSNFWVIAVVLIANTLSIVLTLFCIIMGEWPGAYAYLVLCTVVLYVYCGLGTLVEVANIGFIDACYTEVLWYKLSTSEQKMLRVMLMMTQNVSGLTVAGVVPLTMNTGLQITKAVYSYTMMLIRFLE